MNNISDELKNGKHDLLSCVLNDITDYKERASVLKVRTSDGKVRKVFLNSIFAGSTAGLKKLLISDYGLVSRDEIKINFFNIEIIKDEIYLSDKEESLLIIEPDWLINVTDLTYFDFCPRSLLNKRFSVDTQKEIMIRGSVVHDVFENIIKNPSGINTAKDELKKSLNKHILDFAILETDVDRMYKDFIVPQLNALIKYTKSAADNFSRPQTETLIINPYIGLKGRIDVIVKQGEKLKAIELKTGKSWGGKVKDGHAFQAQAYCLLMELKPGNGQVTYPSIIYSGDHEEIALRKMNYGFMEKEASFGYKDKAEIIRLRNELVLSDYLFDLSYEKNYNKCKNCREFDICLNLFNLEENHLPQNIHAFYLTNKKSFDEAGYLPEEKKFFAKYNKLLSEEYKILKEYSGSYLSLPAGERIISGKCIKIDDFKKLQNNEYDILCSNTSEIRENDCCILSDKNGPIEGQCIEASAIRVSAQGVRAVSRVPVDFKPLFLDMYSSESTFENNYSAVYSLINDGSIKKLKNVLLKNEEPEKNEYIDAEKVIDCKDLNSAQIKSISLSLGLGNYLLIQGPPGSGKTFTIAKITEALNKAGKSVIIACYTHRAIDEVIKKIKKHAPSVLIYKLGSTESNTDYADILLEESLNKTMVLKNERELNKKISRAKEIIAQKPVFIATTNAWLSGRYDGLAKDGLFDTAIIDEAAQVILPGAIGTIRLAEKFIMVGDHRQLAPVVQSQKAKELSKSLFEMLFERKYADESISIMLDRQYRMPPETAGFISKEFYGKKLLTDKTCVKEPELRKETDPKIFKILDPSSALAIVDINSAADEKKPRTAADETNIIVDIVGEYLKNKVMPSQIGIIAPFRAQVADIRRGIEKKLGSFFKDSMEIRKMADTVDRFQGDERDYIIFSLALTGAQVPLALREERRFNVAISRAKKKFIAIGNWKFADKIKTLKNLKKYAQENKGCSYILLN